MRPALINALLLSLLFAPLAHAASVAAPPGGGAPVDQVVIEATRANLAKLGQDMLAIEYRFYRRYNELNTKRDYAVDCYKEARTGSRFIRSYCQPAFQSNAELAEARAFLLYLQSIDKFTGNATSTLAAPATMAIEAGRPGFKKNMIEVTHRSPELIKLLDEHAALVKRFEDMYRRVNGAHPRSVEKAAAPAAPAAAQPPRSSQ
ncbi:MAG: hypothetical protein WDO56_26625 [Gammaproteobacteria bacterium]